MTEAVSWSGDLMSQPDLFLSAPPKDYHHDTSNTLYRNSLRHRSLGRNLFG